MLRLDGFVSIYGPYADGELTTEPLRFADGRLPLNYAAPAGGSLCVELQAADGKPRRRPCAERLP